MNSRMPEGQPPLSVVFIDDHEIVAVAVRSTIDALPGFEFAGWFTSAGQLLASQVLPGLVLLDLNLADGSTPVKNIEQLRNAAWPVIAYTAGEDPYALRRAAKAGVLGIVLKSAPIATLIDALGRAARGEVVASSEWAGAIDSDPDLAAVRLTRQEQVVLERYASGMAAKSVGVELGISEHTVEDYLRRIRNQYSGGGRNAGTKVDLYKRALEDGYLPRPRLLP